MNTVVTSKEEILKTSRELLQKQGWSAVNIRSVAAACDVSVGSIYNYFSSKTELVGAIVESVWCEIFHRPEKEEAFQDIRSCIVWMYARMEYGCKQYPGFFCAPLAGLYAGGQTGWQAADAANLAAYPVRLVRSPQAGPQYPARCL